MKKYLTLFVLISAHSLHAYIYKKTKQDITVQITDYMHKPHVTIIHAENPITAQDIYAVEIRPIRITIHNKSDQPVTISRKSCTTPTISFTQAYKALRRWQVIKPTLIFMPFTTALQWIARYPFNGFPYAEKAANFVTKMLFIARGLYTCILFTENENLKVALKEQCLFQKITIEPGDYVVDKIILLNKKTMSDACLTFKIFDNTYTEEIARFKIDLEK